MMSITRTKVNSEIMIRKTIIFVGVLPVVEYI